MKCPKRIIWVVYVGIVLATPISHSVFGSTSTKNSVLTGHTGPVECITFSNNGTLLLSGSSDHTVRLWDMQKGVLKTTLSGHSNGVCAVAFCQDDKLAVSAGYDNTVKLWDLQNGTLKKNLTEKSFVCSLAVSPEGKTVATSEFERVRIWNVETGSMERELKFVFGEVRMLAGKAVAMGYLPDGQSLIGIVLEKTIIVQMEGSFCQWDSKTGKLVRAVPIRFFYDDWPNMPNDRAAGLSRDGSFLAFWTGKRRKEIWLWDMKVEKKRLILEDFEDIIWSFSFSPDNKILALACFDNSIRFIDTQTGAEKKKLIFQDKETPFGIMFSPRGDIFAAGMQDGTVRIWTMGSIFSGK